MVHKVPHNHVNFLCPCTATPSVFQLLHRSGSWNQSAQHWSHMTPRRKRYVFAVSVIHQSRQPYSPQTQCYIRWQSAVEVTISVACPATFSGQWVCIRLGPFAVFCQLVWGGRVGDVDETDKDGTEGITVPLWWFTPGISTVLFVRLLDYNNIYVF